MNCKFQISNCRWRIVAAMALLGGAAFGQGLSGGAGESGGAGLSATAAAAGGSFQALETFDTSGGTGFDLVGWTKNNGMENPDYVVTILEGTQSLLLSASGDYIKRTAAAAQNTTYYHFLIQVNSLAVFIDPLSLRAAGSEVARVHIYTDGRVTVQQGTIFAPDTPSGVMAINTTYHLWVTYTKSTGGNGFMSVGVSTTGTRPTSGSGFTSTSTGDSTSQIDEIRLRNDGTTQVIFDRFIENNTQIGDNP